MKQAVLLVVAFLSCCVSLSLCFYYVGFEDSYEVNCPNANNSIADIKVHFVCYDYPCEFNINDGNFGVRIDKDVPEEDRPVLYEVLFTGDGINATASGKVDGPFVERGQTFVRLSAKMEGDLPVGHNGTATVNFYFNEQKKDIPDWCVWTNLTIVSEDEEEEY